MTKLLPQKPLAGFTLIELLFVISIIAVLVAFGLSTYRERALTAKAEKVALQMQQIMQAGANYYTKNSCWPNSWPIPDPGKAPGFCEVNASKPDFITLFMPVGMRNPNIDPNDPNNLSDLQLYNPFASQYGSAGRFFYYEYGRPYNEPARTAGCGNTENNYVNTSNLFEVRSGRLPDRRFAERVATLLPNASVVDDICLGRTYVKAQIPVPGTQAAQGNFIIKSIGKVREGRNFLLTCPAGYKADVIISAQDYRVTKFSFIGALAPHILGYFRIETHCASTTSDPNTYKCWTNSNRQTYEGGSWKEIGEGPMWYYYVAGCCTGSGCGVQECGDTNAGQPACPST